MNPIQRVKNYLQKFEGEAEIGTEWVSNVGTEVYAGPQFGWVTREKYNEYLKDGSVSRGEQTVQKLFGDSIEGISDVSSNVYETWEQNVGHRIPDIPEPNEKIKGALSTTKNVAGKLYNWTIKENVDHLLTIADAPVQLFHHTSKFLDPTGRGWGKSPLTISELLFTLGGGAIKKGGKTLLKQGDEVFEGITKSLPTRQLQPVGVGTDLGNITTKIDDINPAQPLKAVNINDPDYIKWRKSGEEIVTAKVAAGETTNLGQGLTHYVDKSTGTRYRLGTRYKNGRVQYTNVDLDKRGVRDLKRATSIELDDKTLLNLFKGNQKTLDSYKTVNKKVIRKLNEALKEYNDANKLTGGNRLTVEHVFDVQHYGRLGEALPPFSGKGADELFNLTILPKGTNIASGAKARYMDSGDALIKAIREGTFIDYHQTTSDFIKYNVAEKVNKMSKSDWKKFTDLSIKNPTTNTHTLLIQFLSK